MRDETEEVPPPADPMPPAFPFPVVIMVKLDTPVPDGMRKRNSDEVLNYFKGLVGDELNYKDHPIEIVNVLIVNIILLMQRCTYLW